MALKLAIDDPELGPRIRASRILTPQERSEKQRIERLRQKINEAKAIAGDGEKAKELRARLESAMDDFSELRKLEENWLDQEERIKNGEWPEGEAYVTRDEADAIQAFVIREYRPELRRFKVATVFQEKVPPVNRRDRLGTAMKLPGKMVYLSEFHAVITLGFDMWPWLSDQDRQRLIHHELEHLEIEDGALRARTHDFEDFVSIVDLYGLRSQSQRFSTDGQVADRLERFGSQLRLDVAS